MDFKKQLDELKIKLERYDAQADTDEVKAHIDYFGDCMSLETLKAIVDHYTAKRDAILEKEIPLLLGVMGLTEAKFDDGSKIAIQKVVSASTKDKDENPLDKEVLFAWVESKNYKDSIKETLAFPKGALDAEVFEYLKGKGLQFNRDSKIEPVTLTSIVKHVYDEFKELPPETACRTRVFERAKLTK